MSSSKVTRVVQVVQGSIVGLHDMYYSSGIHKLGIVPCCTLLVLSAVGYTPAAFQQGKVYIPVRWISSE